MIIPSAIGEFVMVLTGNVCDDASVEIPAVSVLAKEANDDDAFVVASIEGFLFPSTEYGAVDALAVDVPDIF